MDDPQTTPPAEADKPADDTGSRSRRGDKPLITFTDDGCRTEIRVGALLVLMAVFFPLFLGPGVCVLIGLAGLLLIAIGAPLQAFDARRRGRPGYPHKLAIALAGFGCFMIWDLLWRERLDDPIRIQELPALLAIAGIWLLLWWPVAKPAREAAT